LYWHTALDLFETIDLHACSKAAKQPPARGNIEVWVVS
jgi:hypothetical protein